MTQYIKNFQKFWPLLFELISRDVKIKYRKSVLGVLWTLLNPLLMMIVLSIVFSNLFRFDIENYSLYLLSGQIIFTFYSESTTSAMASILSNGALIKKVYIPKYLFVISRILSSLINIMASYCALIFVMIFTRTELHYTIFLSIIPLILLLIFSTGIGLILAALAVKFRDIMHLYSVFVTALMYLTPVIYPMSALPKWVQNIVNLNPLTGILTMFRDLVIFNRIPEITQILISLAIVILALVVGLRIFYKQQDDFILNL